MRKLFIILFILMNLVASAQWKRSPNQGVDVVADLRKIQGRHGQQAATAGLMYVDDKKGTRYRYDTTITAADDGINIIRPTGVVKGGWQRIQQIPTINLGWGIKLRTDSVTVDADTSKVATIWNMQNYAQPKGSYATTSQLSSFQPIGSYVTTTKEQNDSSTLAALIATKQNALGFTPLQASDITGKKDKSDTTAQSGYVSNYKNDSAKANLRTYTATKLNITDTTNKWQPKMALSIYDLPQVTISQTATIAIAAGIRKVTVSCSGLQVGDRILLTPTASTPTGYGLHDAVCVTTGQMEVTINGPLLAIGASYSFTCKVTVFR